MVEIISTRDELVSVLARESGYLYNDFTGRDPKMCPIHRIGCRQLNLMLRASDGPLAFKKLWSDSLTELVAAIKSRGRVFSACGSEAGLDREIDAASGVMSYQVVQAQTHPQEKAAPPASKPINGSLQSPGGRDLEWQVCADGDQGIVEAWSAFRLPFEPKGCQKEFRDRLAGDLRKLPERPSQILRAQYVSEDRGLADVENVLFYNVGLGAFARTTQKGLRFERLFASVPAPPDPNSGHLDHFMKYSFEAPEAEFARLTEGTVFASWEDVPMHSLGESTPLAAVWLAMKRSQIAILSHAPWGIENFGLRVRVTTSAVPGSAASFVKPLVDGIVAAFSSHDGSDLDELARRVSGGTGASAEQIQGYLMNTDAAILGSRQLLWRRGNGVQWNPADDKCVAGDIQLSKGVAREWRVSGELISLGG